MGRRSKNQKRAEEQKKFERAKAEIFIRRKENMEEQCRDFEQIDRRIARKKKFLDQKYEAAYAKLVKEKTEKIKRVAKKYQRLDEKLQNELFSGIERIDEKKKKSISLRQFLLKMLEERETGKLPDWQIESSAEKLEAEISTAGGTVKSKLTALGTEFEEKFNILMGEVSDSDEKEPEVSAYRYLSRNGKFYLTENNCEFLRLVMIDSDGKGTEYDIISHIESGQMETLNEDVQNQLKDGMYSLAYNPDTRIDKAMVDRRLQDLFGTGSAKITDALKRVEMAVNQMQALQCFSEGQQAFFREATRCLDECYFAIEKKYSLYERLYGEDDAELIEKIIEDTRK